MLDLRDLLNLVVSLFLTGTHKNLSQNSPLNLLPLVGGALLGFTLRQSKNSVSGGLSHDLLFGGGSILIGC